MTPAEHDSRWDPDDDGVELPDDCDDDDPKVQQLSWYTDADGDGFGDPDTAVSACKAPSGTVDNADDCDDAVETTNPDGTEVCNEVDDDCNGEADDGSGAPSTWYSDDDGDLFGNPDAPTSACGQPAGYVANEDDCNDDAVDGPDINPIADDICDEIDNDCDSDIDEDPAFWFDWYVDTDADGYGDENDTPLNACEGDPGDVAHDLLDDMDCHDGDPDTNPGAPEICGFGDNDCDGATDNNPIDTTRWYLDGDGDGHGLVNDFLDLCECLPAFGCYRVDNTSFDCDDTDANISPTELEICANNVDDDCDIVIDEVGCVNCDTGDTGC